MAEHELFLLVEDNENDAMLLRRTFVKSRLLNEVRVVASGQEAIDFLSRAGKYANPPPPRPGLVLLDLQLPDMSGFDVLRWIRNDTKFNDMRVIVLTGSDTMRDVRTAYEMGANSFLIKPIDFERFAEFTQALGGHLKWFNSNPQSSAPAESDVDAPGAAAPSRFPSK